jgi:hypothetical protein
MKFAGAIPVVNFSSSAKKRLELGWAPTVAKGLPRAVEQELLLKRISLAAIIRTVRRIINESSRRLASG